jgi:hypothetical protein
MADGRDVHAQHHAVVGVGSSTLAAKRFISIFAGSDLRSELAVLRSFPLPCAFPEPSMSDCGWF